MTKTRMRYKEEEALGPPPPDTRRVPRQHEEKMSPSISFCSLCTCGGHLWRPLEAVLHGRGLLATSLNATPLRLHTLPAAHVHAASR
ncbi:hypothetical protein SKAU_G00319280 [Synaphobranchus kaupii]|uniref:Uncharacterized protein n=1 Tax=Synaphobranchus kaupii TaxID=118154 RepID=A0A9Q1IIP5_SYNKA|nr:hypothetical protein SKAU_G00319280 [Synaphobranchus kaupii]